MSSKVTPMRPDHTLSPEDREKAAYSLISSIDLQNISIALATDALEVIEDSLARADGGDIEREGLYSIICLVREKLRDSHEKIEETCKAGRSALLQKTAD